MNLYKISQSANNDYDTYDSVIVAAENEDEARKTHPSPYEENIDGMWWDRDDKHSSWAFKLDQVKVEFIGTAKEGTPKGIILASYNAG